VGPGGRLASGGRDGSLRIWTAIRDQESSVLTGHVERATSVSWNPDGTRLASAGLDNSVRIWDPQTGEETLVLRGNSGMFHDVSWHPDGAQLAAASSDGQIWIWDATLGFERDTTQRALTYIDRQVASGTARGEDLRWYADSYIRAGKFTQALVLLKDDPSGLRKLLAKLPEAEHKAFAHSWANAKMPVEPANNADRIELAQLAYDLKKFALASRLFAEALAIDPNLGDHRQAQYRYKAARAAALAAAGKGEDEPPLDDPAKAKLRRQALDWLKV
jgi:tetratricopeptide (TPR) repeat protein